MENQHKKITGYRDLSQDEIDLSQDEIDLMNEVKQMDKDVLDLVNRVAAINNDLSDGSDEIANVVHESEAFRWAAMAKSDLQTGFMKLTRAVAKPIIKN
jgi:hypothetical protein